MKHRRNTETKVADVAVTDFAALIGHNKELHLRGSEVHVLLDALTGRPRPEDREARRELAAALATLTSVENRRVAVALWTERVA